MSPEEVPKEAELQWLEDGVWTLIEYAGRLVSGVVVIFWSLLVALVLAIMQLAQAIHAWRTQRKLSD